MSITGEQQVRTPAIQISALNKSFGGKQALDSVDLHVEQGEFVALIGSSGSGKSTLLRHTSGLVRGDRNSGRIAVLGKVVQEKGRVSRHIRAVRADVGFIFQQFNLVGRLTLLQNVLVGMLARTPTWRSLLGIHTRREKESALYSLYRVGLHEQVNQRASTLSGGQQQRAAIARTMEQRARVILADEPIASLDPESARLVMDSLRRLNEEDRVTIVISLHQVEFALQYCPRTVALKNGRIVYDGASCDLDEKMLQRIYGIEGVRAVLDGTSPLAKKVRPRVEAGQLPHPVRVS